MSLQGEWLCYRPRVFERGRDYQVLAGTQALSAHLTDAFTVVAEGMLRAQGNLTEPTWQYVPLAEERYIALCRCAEGELSGARSLVVWALLLPHAYIRSPLFSIARVPDLFPGPVLGPELPAPLDVARAAQPAADGPDVTALISRYLDTGSVKVNLDPPAALHWFTSVVEMLPPRDRLEVSFSTAPGSARALAVDAAAPAPEDIPVSVEGLARLELWRFARFPLSEAQLQSASLRDRAAGWLCSLLRSQELRSSYRVLLNGVRSRMAASLHEVAFGYLRRALEMRLSELPPREAGRALTALVEDRLLTSEVGVPPLWLPRVALENRCLADLSPALLERVLQADVLPMILESVQQTPRTARVAGLAHAVENARATRSARGLKEACAPLIREVLAQVKESGPRALSDDRTLARALSLLLLHDHARPRARA